jgi:lipopolysaccharide transport system ATP-binding protein
VLFVSHNLPSIEKLCTRVVVIDGGRIVMDGDPSTCIAAYLGSHKETSSGVDLSIIERLDPRLTPVFSRLELRTHGGPAASAVGCGEKVEFHLTYSAPTDIANPSFGIIISSGLGTPLFFLQTRAQLGLIDRAPRSGTVVCRLDRVPLVPGEYLLSLGCLSGERQLDLLEHVASFSVEPRDYFGTGYLPPQSNGPVLIGADWELLPARDELPLGMAG